MNTFIPFNTSNTSHIVGHIGWSPNYKSAPMLPPMLGKRSPLMEGYRLLDHDDMIQGDDEFLEDNCVDWTRIDVQHKWNIGSYWHINMKPMRRIHHQKPLD